MNLQDPILGEGSNLLWTAFFRISYQMNLDTWLQIIFLSWKSLHANAKLFALLRHPSQPCATEGGKQAQTSQQELCTGEGSNYFRRIYSDDTFIMLCCKKVALERFHLRGKLLIHTATRILAFFRGCFNIVLANVLIRQRNIILPVVFCDFPHSKITVETSDMQPSSGRHPSNNLPWPKVSKGNLRKWLR